MCVCVCVYKIKKKQGIYPILKWEIMTNNRKYKPGGRLLPPIYRGKVSYRFLQLYKLIISLKI